MDGLYSRFESTSSTSTKPASRGPETAATRNASYRYGQRPDARPRRAAVRRSPTPSAAPSIPEPAPSPPRPNSRPGPTCGQSLNGNTPLPELRLQLQSQQSGRLRKYYTNLPALAVTWGFWPPACSSPRSMKADRPSGRQGAGRAEVVGRGLPEYLKLSNVDWRSAADRGCLRPPTSARYRSMSTTRSATSSKVTAFGRRLALGKRQCRHAGRGQRHGCPGPRSSSTSAGRRACPSSTLAATPPTPTTGASSRASRACATTARSDQRLQGRQDRCHLRVPRRSLDHQDGRHPSASSSARPTSTSVTTTYAPEPATEKEAKVSAASLEPGDRVRRWPRRPGGSD
ncbi:hypothetical protein ACRAWD_13955 [Caulobacter segnis]